MPNGTLSDIILGEFHLVLKVFYHLQLNKNYLMNSMAIGASYFTSKSLVVSDT